LRLAFLSSFCFARTERQITEAPDCITLEGKADIVGRAENGIRDPLRTSLLAQF
jgi:hypothetical protein